MAQKGTEKFKETIKAYLDKLAGSGDFALSYANPNKSLDECIDYILTQVKSSGCAGFTDEEIYGMAVHYYDEENPGEIKRGLGGQVVVNHHVELTEEEVEEARRKALMEELYATGIPIYCDQSYYVHERELDLVLRKADGHFECGGGYKTFENWRDCHYYSLYENSGGDKVWLMTGGRYD